MKIQAVEPLSREAGYPKEALTINRRRPAMSEAAT